MAEKEFVVEAKEVHRFQYTVTAETEEEARQHVQEDLGPGADQEWTDGFHVTESHEVEN